MQIMPATGRSFARRLGIKPFRTARLTEPEVNVTIGTQYFADLVRAVRRRAPTRWPATTPASIAWCGGSAERPGLPDDEWIDDIPFPETQNYVKRILGTAEDYRRLYGGGRRSRRGVVDALAAGSRRRRPPAPTSAAARSSEAPARKTAGPPKPRTSCPRRVAARHEPRAVPALPAGLSRDYAVDARLVVGELALSQGTASMASMAACPKPRAAASRWKTTCVTPRLRMRRLCRLAGNRRQVGDRAA